MWQSDITSFHLPRDSRRVYLVAFVDDHSRFIVSWALACHQKSTLVIEAVTDGLGRFGRPDEILTVQGRQYYAWRGKSGFTKLLEREGIDHIVSRAQHPQTLGKCERLWQTGEALQRAGAAGASVPGRGRSHDPRGAREAGVEGG